MECLLPQSIDFICTELIQRQILLGVVASIQRIVLTYFISSYFWLSFLICNLLMELVVYCIQATGLLPIFACIQRHYCEFKLS